MKLNERIKKIANNKNEEDNKMKSLSLKKKILVGVGLMGAAALGVIAYGKKNSNDDTEEDYIVDDYDSDADDEDYDATEDESEGTEETESN